MEICKQCSVELTWENKSLCVKCGDLICDKCSLEGKYKCKECSDEGKIELPSVIRRSSIEDYKSCPYYFKLHVIDGNEPDQNVMARLGSDLHDLYEQIQREDVEVEDIGSQTDWIMAHIETDFPEEDMQRLWDRAETCNESFLKLLPNMINKPIAFEERIAFEVGSNLPKVTIAYDRLEEDENGDLHIIDWKTGKIMSGKKLTTDLQVPLYLQAVKEKYGRMPKSFTLVYLGDVDKNGNYKTRKFTSIDDNKFMCSVGKKVYIQDIQEQLRVVKKLFSQMANGHFSIPAKPDYFKCKMCSFAKKGMCQGVGIQEWINVNEGRHING